jgi:hypothetical protein
MRTIVVVAMSAGILLAGAADVAAQCCQWRGSGGWGPGAGYGRMYDPSTVETITGEVVSVDYVTPMQGMGRGVHMIVERERGKVDVHLGPAWYVENQDVQIGPKDHVEVKGSRVTLAGAPVMIAAEVRKGDAVMVLRDESGIPRWAGWRRGPRGS